MNLFITILYLTLLMLLQISCCTPCNFPALINFGDSNSDTGSMSAAFSPFPYPNGETFFNMPAGRCSDGRLIIDFIAESLGLANSSAYIDSLGANFSHGANFAAASATIPPQDKPVFPGGAICPFTLDVQLKQFSQFKSRSQIIAKRGGVFESLMPKEEYFPKALYTFDIGQNDVTQLLSDSNTTDEHIQGTIQEAMELFSTIVKGVYDNGGRYFWIHNTGPLGCLSYIVISYPGYKKDSIGCIVHINKLAQKFNKMLKDTVALLRIALPSATFTYVDVYSAKYYLLSHAHKYGFENPLRACCGYGGGDYNVDYRVSCGGTAIINGTEVHGESCPHPEKSIIWDGTHYTEAANKWVFNEIATGKYSHPPLPLDQACRQSTTSAML